MEPATRDDLPPTAGLTRPLTVRYFAGAAAAAGTDEDQVETTADTTVGRLTATLAARRGPALARVLAASSFLLDGIRAQPEDLVGEHRQLDVLPPFAGG